MLKSIMISIIGGLLGTAAVFWLAAAHGSDPAGSYRITIQNANPGQNFSPPVIILHAPGYRLFELGQPASVALWRLAEDGATGEFQALADPEVRQVLVAEPVHRRRSPVVETAFEPQTNLLMSVAAMLSLTNDGFVAARSIRLPQAVGATTSTALRAYDAGSEANTESCAHVPCEVHDQRMTHGAEGVITEHLGIRGDADIPSSRGWIGPDLGKLTITRLR